MSKRDDEMFEPTWRPRNDNRGEATGFGPRRPLESDAQGDERWRSRDFHQNSGGYNPIGSDYLREVGVSQALERGPYRTAWHTAREPWRRENADGPHVGRGPKGYVRSDERIKEEACDRLMRHGQVDATNIEVEVSSGEIILRGEVDSRRTKRLAEDILDDIPGVRDISNQLRVRTERL